jgi:hypothetical protein
VYKKLKAESCLAGAAASCEKDGVAPGDSAIQDVIQSFNAGGAAFPEKWGASFFDLSVAITRLNRVHD